MRASSQTRRYKTMRPEAPTSRLDQPCRLMTRHVMALSGWSHSTLYARIAAGRFPRPRKDGRMSWWMASDVLAALGLDESSK